MVGVLSTSKLGAGQQKELGQNWLLLDSHGRLLQKCLWQTEKGGVSQEPSVCLYLQPQAQCVLSTDLILSTLERASGLSHRDPGSHLDLVHSRQPWESACKTF